MKPKDRLSEIVTLRMNRADHERLMRDAKAAELSVSAFLQDCWRKVRR
jgi:predicted HicB family RNase H-like nuclease